MSLFFRPTRTRYTWAAALNRNEQGTRGGGERSKTRFTYTRTYAVYVYIYIIYIIYIYVCVRVHKVNTHRLRKNPEITVNNTYHTCHIPGITYVVDRRTYYNHTVVSLYLLTIVSSLLHLPPLYTCHSISAQNGELVISFGAWCLSSAKRFVFMVTCNE